jgi:serine protease
VQQNAIADALSQGVVVVVAAGNDAQDAAGFRPASCDGVITVAAGETRGRLASRYSNFGATVEIMAPGGDVLRDDDGDGNPDGVLSLVDPSSGTDAFYNGTSMAAPHVAGVAALMLAVDPSLTPAQSLGHLQTTARPRNASQCPQPCGAGLLDAGAAVAAVGGVPHLTLSRATLDLGVGKSKTLVATTQPGTSVAFSSDDASVSTVAPATATADAAGEATVTVTGVAAGAATVSATGGGASDATEVRVNASPGLSIPALVVFLSGVSWWLWRRREARG